VPYLSASAVVFHHEEALYQVWGVCTFKLGLRACRRRGSSYSVRVPSLKFVGLPIPKTWLRWLIFDHGVTLTFALSTSKWVTFLPVFCFLRPARLVSGTGQTDRQTDNSHQCIMPPHYAWGGDKIAVL